MPLKPSRNTRLKKSRAISRQRAEQFLLALANLRGAWPLTGNDETELRRTIEALDNLRLSYKDLLADCEPVGILVLREFVRKAWDAPDERRLEWWACQFRDYAHKMTKRVSSVRVRADSLLLNPQPLPRVPSSLAITFSEAVAIVAQAEPVGLTPLEEVGARLPQLMKRAKRCANPDCRVTPYFLAEKNSRKFCSDVCAIPAQRAAKLRWWNANLKNKGKKSRKHKRGRKQQ